MGILDPVTDLVFGDTPQASTSGAFPGLKQLGGEYEKYLMQRLMTPASQSMQYFYGSQAIRDALSQEGATARQRLGDVATTRGWLDSGTVIKGMTDIERGQAEAYAGEITKLLLGLEDRREQNVLPYLSAGAGEAAQIAGLNIGAELNRDAMQWDMISTIGTASTGGGYSDLFG